MATLPLRGEDIVQPHLSRGERILWTGRPDPKPRLHKSDLVAIPFSVLWTGFAVFWEASVIADGGPLSFVLFGLPFVLIGVYITVGRFVQQARLKKRIWYAVTDRRVLELERTRSGERLESAFIDKLPAVTREVGADGVGSVVFGAGSRWQSRFEGFGAEEAPPGFYDIRDVSYVADLITGLRQDPPEQELH